MKSSIRLVITDVDNTLYDWLAFYIPSFLAMIQELHRLTGVDCDALKRSFSKVHQTHRTSEYAFAIQELEALQTIDSHLSAEERVRKYGSAIDAFRSMRKKTLKLYPGVKNTLERLQQEGMTIVAHSDSMMSYVSRRLRQLDIDRFFSAICAPRDHGVPEGLDPGVVRRFALDLVESRTRRLEYSPDIRKPDIATLAPIFNTLRVPPKHTVYVGDSLSRDVLLARRAGISDIWARYGHQHENGLYNELLQITYWTEKEVKEEERLRRELGGAPPSYVVDSFSEILARCGLT
ncbi:MAG: HAD family hydrolase [Deltaproteobacteria bacterium]|nr:HAD family hydrolase [Deltaproteobacteria bacterium]